jgi:glutathione S-transferase
VLTLYDAARCPYCARVRIVLAEKGIPYDPVEVDLDVRPAWLIELNPPAGRVPVIEEAGGVLLPESAVIMEYLDERFPEPRLLPEDPAERALARLAVERFSELGDAYYDVYLGRQGGSAERLEGALAALDRRLGSSPYLAGRSYSLADIAYVPWLFRVETRLGLDLSPYEGIAGWLERLLGRPAVAAEREVVAAL